MRSLRSMILPLAALLALPAASHVAIPQPVGPAPHVRLLPLQGGQNFRDLGGYHTRDGRTVRWGLLFRSGSMHALTPADYSYLLSRGIRTVCDFRSVEERHSEPVAWPKDKAPQILSDDYPMASLMSGIGLKPGVPATAATVKAVMTVSYPRMLTQFNGQYRRMFLELLAGRVPLAFNCSAGKDRTGIAAALLLTALGVPHNTVVADYLLTNRYFDTQKIVRGQNPNAGGFAELPPDVLRAYMAADSDYIEAALKMIESHTGGAEGYFRDELGISHTDLIQLRRMYTV